ncbi:MAG: SDR family oxidoreductase [Bacteroidia bacterium]|nr:SDR family oxidoreductase [Bacteroidia bacterium]
MAFALITGGSGGIGLCLARELASRKHDILLVARSAEKLANLCSELRKEFNIRAEFLPVDLSTPDAHLSVKSWLNKNSFEVDMLINNAGYGVWSPVEKASLAELTNMMNLNMNTLVSLCYMLLPELKKQPKSFILNVASTAAYQAVPTLATYAASKSFVVLFTRGLRMELKKSTVSVSCLSPGATSTGFVDRAGMDSLKERAEKFSMKPEAVAKIGIAGMLKGKAEIIPGFINWLSVNLTYFGPKNITEKVAEGLYKTN